MVNVFNKKLIIHSPHTLKVTQVKLYDHITWCVPFGVFPFLQPEPQKWGQFMKYRNMASCSPSEQTLQDARWGTTLLSMGLIRWTRGQCSGPGVRGTTVQASVWAPLSWKWQFLCKSCAFYILQGVNDYTSGGTSMQGNITQKRKRDKPWACSCLDVSSENYAEWIKANLKG